MTDMMYRFCTSGLRTDPGVQIRSDGYTPGAQVVAQHLNWFFGEIIDKVNEIIQRGPNSVGCDTYQGLSTIIQNYYPAGGDHSWSLPYDGANVIDMGGTKAYIGLAPYYNANVAAWSRMKLLALDAASTSIDVFDVQTMAWESNSGTLSGSKLPTGSGQTWVARCMCTDGEYVYVMFTDTHASPDTHIVQCYRINGWATRTAWGTGTALPGTGSVGNFTDIKNVSAGQIATANSWISISSGSSTAITIIGKDDGAIDGSGAGDATGGVALKLTSDGTNIFFTTSADQICSCTIATPTVGCGGTAWPLDTESGESLGDIINLGAVGVAVTQTYMYFFSADDAGLANYHRDNDVYFHDMGSLCFDGMNLWSRGTVEGFSYDRFCLIKFNQAHIDGGSAIDLEALSKTYVVTPENAGFDGDTSVYYAPICFDGRDIWFIGDSAASGDYSGKIMRLPLAHWR